MSDSEQSDSQSDFNHLNKLNPDDSESQSQPLHLINQEKQPAIQHNFTSNTQSRTQTKSMPLNLPQPILENPKIDHPAPKKQLMLIKQNKPRLIIDHLILKNFKSYAGTQKIGPFHKNFTSIVGPNGSGKSNLIESMLFIFGFNASWMRLNKLHQLIHNSSELGNVGSAAVEVHFKKILDNQDGSITEIPDSKFFIRRTVNTSSTSKYYINGNDSTQAEVKTKLKSEGIDLTNNRFLILQGEVEQISQMKQKSGDRDKPGFLEYLEDIIGSNQFIDRIEQAVKEYNTNQESKHQKGQRMKIVENELKNMTSQKEQAIKYVKRQRKIYQVESILHQVLRSNSEYTLKKVQQRHDQLEARKNEIIKEQKEKLAKQQERVREIKKLKEEAQKIDKDLARDQNKMKELDNEDKNIKNQISYNSQDQAKYEKGIAEIDAQFTKIVEESDAIKKNLPEKQYKLKQLKEKVQELRQQVSKHDRPELRTKIKNIQNQINKVKHQRNAFQDKHQTLKQQVAKNSEVGQQGKVGQFKQELRKALQMKTKIQIALQKAVEQQTRTRSQYNNELDIRNRMKHQANMLDSMIKQKNSQRFEQGQFNNLFNHIMKANIPGVLGRLGDLGDVPKQYEEPMTTACSRLDNIVCQTVDSAQRVLDLLKTNRLGRATCIILEKITDYRDYMNRPFKAPQDSIRLFDTIKPASEQVRVAFYFAISNTLYCQNVDLAKDLSMGDDNNRRRVIAPNRRGYIIYEMNGSMNSQNARRGGFEKKAQKKKTDQDDKQNQQRLQHVVQKLEEKNQVIQKIQTKLKQCDENIKTMKSQATLYENKIRQFADQLKDLQRAAQRNRGRKNAVQNMQNQMKALQKQIQKLKNQIDQLEKQLTQVQNEQKKYETPQITQMREEYKKLRQECANLEKEVEKQQVLITTVEKRLKENQKKKKQTQNMIEKLQQMIEKSKKDMQKIQQIGMEILTQIQANKSKRTECQRKQEAIRRQLDQDDEAVRQSRQKIEQARAQVQNVKRQLNKLTEDVKFAISELERIRKLYKEMTSTYDFIDEIDEIEKMNLEQSVNEGSSLLDMTMHNMSLEATDYKQAASTNKKRNQNEAKNLDMKKIQKTDPYKDLTEEQLDQFLLYEAKLRAVLGNESSQIKKMEGKNLAVISQYKAKFIDYKQKLKEFNEVKQKQNQLKKLINDLKEQRFQMFREGFSIINSKLKEVYQLLTNGGDAEMQLIDSLDPFSDGVNFSVRPPKKAWKQINKLSGGQKTLSSLSLIFALHYYKPTPLYFMDEIDAALDFKNVSIVGDYIKKRTKDAQFIIISLRNNMFDLADKLVGVYKTFDQTKVINLAAGKLMAKKQQQNNEQEKKEKENLSVNLPQLEM